MSASPVVEVDLCAVFSRFATVSGEGDLERVRVILRLSQRKWQSDEKRFYIYHKILIEITGENGLA